MTTRRTFLKHTAGGTMLALFGFGGTAGMARALAQVATSTLDPGSIPKFQEPLLVPPVMPRAGKVTIKGGASADYYEIALQQFQQQILPTGLPATKVWGYGPARIQGGAAALFNAPSLTIEAKVNQPVRIKWINQLVDANKHYLPHLLPVDPTLHWANPPGGTESRDSHSQFDSTPGPYTGPVPMVVHVHGAVGVGDESDGYAEAWYLPAATDIPSDYATTGTWYNFFAGKAEARFGATWGSGFAVSQYPNRNRASTLWYHDHTLGMTRTNVYAGPAGFYIVRGGPGDRVLDSRSGLPAVLPGPAPGYGDPAGLVYYEIPLAIQDRSFNTDGSLFYPDSRAFFDEIEGPYIPESDIPPIWNPEFFANCIMVNGKTWPFLAVEQRRYRFRLLNGCNSRFLILDFSPIPGVQVSQIGNEGGFLAAPVNITAGGGRLLLAPAERADVIVDFSQVPLGDYILANRGPDEPFGGGEPDTDFPPADQASTGQILQFRVEPAVAADPSTPPEFLRLPAIAPLPAATVTRPLALLEQMSTSDRDGPVMALLGTLEKDANGIPSIPTRRLWMEAVSENPALGATEIWEIYNTTADAHPIHIHEVAFAVVNRQNMAVDGNTGKVALQGDPVAPPPGERGLKDTVIAYPGQVTRVKMKFDTAGQFVWHCHIVEHEDNEMMRPYRIGPEQPGQPG